MRLSLDFEPGGTITEAFRLQSYRADVDPSDRLKNLNREIVLKAEKHMPEMQAKEVRKILISLIAEAARIGCMNGFEYCATVTTEKTVQAHKRGDFSDRERHADDGAGKDRRPRKW